MVQLILGNSRIFFRSFHAFTTHQCYSTKPFEMAMLNFMLDTKAFLFGKNISSKWLQMRRKSVLTLVSICNQYVQWTLFILNNLKFFVERLSTTCIQLHNNRCKLINQFEEKRNMRNWWIHVQHYSTQFFYGKIAHGYMWSILSNQRIQIGFQFAANRFSLWEMAVEIMGRFIPILIWSAFLYLPEFGRLMKK